MTTSFNNSSVQNDRQLPGGEQASRKRLFRSDRDKVISGVAGGLAEYLDMDATVVRLLWVLVAIFTGGAAFWLYLALWLFLPIGDNARGQTEKPVIVMSQKSMGIVAWALMALGVLWLLANFGILPALWSGFRGVFGILNMVFWPLLLIAGGWLLLSKLGQTDAITQKMKSGFSEGDSVKASVKNGYQSVRSKTPLKRSKDDRLLLGVCGGIARWLNIDPIVVRVLWALFTIAFLGTGVIVYIILAFIMPEEDDEAGVEIVEGEVLDPIATPPTVDQ